MGNKVEWTYDSNSNVTKTVSTELEPGNANGRTFTVTETFDEIDRLVLTHDQGPDGVYGNADDRTATFGYDSRGNIVKTTDPKGIVAQFSYDFLSRRVLAQHDALGLNIQTRWAYDLNSRLITYTGIRKNGDDPGQYHTTTYTYDRLNRPAGTSFADGRTTSTVYDPASNVLSSTDSNGSVFTNTYDVLERLSTVSIAPGVGVQGTTSRGYAYDGLSRMTVVTDNNDPNDPNDDSTVVLTYDGLSRSVSEQQVMGNFFFGSSKTVNYTYNNGAPGTPDRLNLSQINYADGTAVAFGRDALDRVTSIGLGGDATNKIAGFDYAGTGRTLKSTHYSGTAAPVELGSTRLIFDGVKRVNSYQSTLSNTQVIAGFEYGYDQSDNRVYSKHTHANNTGEIYRYDSGYRVTEANYGVSAGDISLAENAVAQGADIGVVGIYARKVAYALDNLGNRSGVTETLSGQAPTTTTSSSNPANSDYAMNRVSNMGGLSVSYDANGNTVDDGIYQYQYDALNRMIGVIHKADNLPVAAYKYDGMGRRLGKTVTNVSAALNGSTRYVYQGQMVIEEYNTTAAETQTARYINGRCIDERICMERRNVSSIVGVGTDADFQRFYYYTDILGSVRAVTWLDPTTVTEKLIERVDYDIYGQPTFTNWGGDRIFGTADDASATASLIGNPYLFTGQTYDAETGNYYYRARYYSPGMGRFLCQDPAGYIDGPNMYQYCRNNPIKYRDPFGMQSAWEFIKDVASGIAQRSVQSAYMAVNPGNALGNAIGSAIMDYSQTGSSRSLQNLVPFWGTGLQISNLNSNWNNLTPSQKFLQSSDALTRVAGDGMLLYGGANYVMSKLPAPAPAPAVPEVVVPAEVAPVPIEPAPFTQEVTTPPPPEASSPDIGDDYPFEDKGNQTSAANPTPDAQPDVTPGKMPTDLHAFGAKTQGPRAPRFSDLDVTGPTDVVGPETPPSPKGASTFGDPGQAPLGGAYHRLPAGTQLPDGLGVVADGKDVLPESPHEATHHTTYPTVPMSFQQFIDLFKSLPWTYAGKK